MSAGGGQCVAMGALPKTTSKKYPGKIILSPSQIAQWLKCPPKRSHICTTMEPNFAKLDFVFFATALKRQLRNRGSEGSVFIFVYTFQTSYLNAILFLFCFFFHRCLAMLVNKSGSFPTSSSQGESPPNLFFVESGCRGGNCTQKVSNMPPM